MAPNQWFDKLIPDLPGNVELVVPACSQAPGPGLYVFTAFIVNASCVYERSMDLVTPFYQVKYTVTGIQPTGKR
jgi:hypothetical protein